MAERVADKQQTWHSHDIEVVAISRDSYCITNSEGEELTSTFFVTNEIMINVTDSYHVHTFFKKLLVAELIRRELTQLTLHTIIHPYLPSGTEHRERFKPERRRIIQRKWALPRNKHTLVEGRTASSSHNASKRALKSYQSSQGDFRCSSKIGRASLIEQSRKNSSHKTSNLGTLAATQLAISHANMSGSASIKENISKGESRQKKHVIDMTSTYQGASAPRENIESGHSERGKFSGRRYSDNAREDKNKQWSAAQAPRTGHPQWPETGARKDLCSNMQGGVDDNFRSTNRENWYNKQQQHKWDVKMPKTGPSLTNKSWITKGLKPDRQLVASNVTSTAHVYKSQISDKSSRQDQHQDILYRKLPKGTPPPTPRRTLQ